MLLRSWLIAGALAATAVLATGCGSPEERAPIERAALDDWRIKPGVRVGSMDRASSELDLAQAYGYANVRDSIITLGEGERARGTLVFPTDPQRRLEIIWGDAALKREPQRIVLRGERSRWMLPGDISLGTSLADLERMNGRPFRLSGFGWDYSGAVISWNGGALDSLLTGVKLYLEPRIENRAGRANRRVQGDKPFDSTNPDVRSLDPRVYQIFVDLAPPVPGRTP
jgi:hypothetical protein